MPRPPILAFDCETIPDVAGLRRLHSMPAAVPDAEVVEFAKRLLRQKKGHDFFPPHLQRVAVISCVLRNFAAPESEQLRLFSLPAAPAPRTEGDPQHEQQTIAQFYQLIDDYEPILVSWNGGGFDLPVLQQRAIIHGLQAKTYHRADGDYKWNNYHARFHERHTDLMDVIAMHRAGANAGLNDFAVLCGLPGKLGIGGAGVWDAWQNNQHAAIRDYCECDALLTYLLYLRYQHFRHRLSLDAETARVQQFLQTTPARHCQQFLATWRHDQQTTTLL